MLLTCFPLRQKLKAETKPEAKGEKTRVNPSGRVKKPGLVVLGLRFQELLGQREHTEVIGLAYYSPVTATDSTSLFPLSQSFKH